MNLLKRELPVNDGIVTKVFEYLGRVLLAAIFLFAAIGKFVDTESIQGMITQLGLPGFFVWPAAFIDIGIALAIIFGVSWRILGTSGAIYCIALGVLYHFRPDSPNDMIHFAKNLSIAGGLILLAMRAK